MKTKLGLTLAIATLAACWLAGPPGSAGIPQPSFILYGQAADEYGWPYTTEAVVTLWINERSFKTYAVSGRVREGHSRGQFRLSCRLGWRRGRPAD
jgi:hypothetical protein